MNFNELQVNPLITKAIEKKEFLEMTEIQEKVIPVALEGNDVIGQAPTGTGKTLAYTIPILNQIDEKSRDVEAIIIAPTRELAVQITSDINEISEFMRIKAVTLYGGEMIEKQITALKKKPQIIVATPGRLLDHLNRRTVRIDNVKIVVLDEADEMLDMGFRDDINSVLEATSENHQTMLFSATFSKEVEDIARKFMNDPQKICVNHGSLTVERIEQKYACVAEKDKVEVMARIIEINEYKLSMVFCNTKKAVDEVTSQLLTRGFLAEALHGDMKQMQRDRVMARFREGTINILVASDVAARGLDIDNVDVVFNYDLPTDDEYYVHRIGRTGRASKSGLSISLITPRDRWHLKSIIKYAKTEINVLTIPSLDKVIKVRANRLLARAMELANENNNFEDVDYNNNKYLSIIQKQVEKYSDVDKDSLIKGLMSIIINADERNNEIEEVKEEVDRRSAKYGKNGVRMFITLGRKDDIKIYTITDLLVKSTNLTNADINAVTICDSFSFFEIPASYVDDVIALSNELRYKGRKLVIEETKNPQKPKTRSGRRSYEHDSSDDKRSYSKDKKDSLDDKRSYFKDKKDSSDDKRSYFKERKNSSDDKRSYFKDKKNSDDKQFSNHNDRKTRDLKDKKESYKKRNN